MTMVNSGMKKLRPLAHAIQYLPNYIKYVYHDSVFVVEAIQCVLYYTKLMHTE